MQRTSGKNHWLLVEQLKRMFSPLESHPLKEAAGLCEWSSILCISFLNPQSQSYSLSEGRQPLYEGQAQPLAAVQPLSHPSGSGEPEFHQPVSTLFSLQIIGMTRLSHGPILLTSDLLYWTIYNPLV